MRVPSLPPPGPRVLPLLFFTTGLSGLVFEVVWSRLYAPLLGSTLAAATAVLVSYLGGLALGAWVLGRRADLRGASIRQYGVLEIGVALAAVAAPFLLTLATPAFDALATRAAGSLPALLLVRLGAGLLVLPATFLMGGTLPVLVLAYVRANGGTGPAEGFALLYAVNTLGAAAGAFVGAFLLLPFLGIPGALGAAALLNLAVGLWCVLARPAPVPASPAPAPRRHDPASEGPALRPWVLLSAALLSGWTVLLLEVALFRLLALLIGASVYAFSLMLAAFILGLGLGAWIAGRVARSPGPLRVLFPLSQGAAAVVLWLLQLGADRIPHLVQALVRVLAGRPVALLAAESIGLVAVLLVPTTLLGIGFPAIVRLRGGRSEGFGGRLGSLYAANTAGALLGAAGGGFVALPKLGCQGAVLFGICLALGSAALLAFATPGTSPWMRRALGPSLLALLLAASLVRFPWDLRALTVGPYLYEARDVDSAEAEVLFHREGPIAAVSVWRVKAFLSLKVDGKTDASNDDDMSTQVFCSSLPVLLHPAPRRVLLVGLASGVSAGAALRIPGVERLDCVEIEPAMVPASEYFRPWNGGVLADPRLALHIEDARAFLRSRPGPWDVIVSEPSNPWIAGVANLYTREFFRTIRERLAPGGIACQWVQAYNLPQPTLRLVLRTFLAEFPDATLWSTSREASDLLLVGMRDGPLSPPGPDFESRLRAPGVARSLDYAFVGDRTDFYLRYLCGPESLRRMAGEGPLQTEWRPRIEFSAPLGLYQPDLYTRNLSWLRENRERITGLFPIPPGDPERYEESWAARGLVLEALEAAFGPTPLRFEPLLREAVTRAPDDRDARRALSDFLLQRGILLYERSNDLRGAIDSASEAVRVDPGFHKAHLWLALFLDDAGFPERALGHYRQYLDSFPWHAEIWKRMILVFRQIGDEASARQAEIEAAPYRDSPPRADAK